ncbi:TIM barrel protein [Paenibacillus sp. 5J-6]|uniref:TIM barrel protein n=1 Tax=Paenibacillus silvestris TaxID=2606219 RepID=A0A6L8V5I9_9BACL|nr:sugar phosphate isomerase/epimerase [Paenibacillus silvestris]MZQ85547.1 TIM barrel protein [Paenibacillus silvestris]
MTRLGFSTLPCDGWSLDEMIQIAKRCGFSALELREGTNWAISAEMNAEMRRTAVHKFDEAGLRISNIGSSVCFTGHEGDLEQHEQLQKVIVLASDLKAGGVRIFLGYFRNRRDQPVPTVDYDQIVRSVREACEYATSYGVEIWIETHNEFATGRSLKKLLDDVDRANCAVIYDIIHPLEEDESPQDTIALLGSRLAHVHMKDGVPFADKVELSWKYTKVGEGDVPISAIIQLLNQADYKGCYSLEWETKWRKELQLPGMEPETIFPAYIEFMRTACQTREK